MNEMLRYDAYAVRVVPDTARGEFVNVGVVVGSAHGDWDVRMVGSLGRASSLATGKMPLRGVQSVLDRIARLARLAGGRIKDGIVPELSPSDAAQKLLHQIPRSYNLVQFSQPMPSVGHDASEVADRLFRLLVDASESQPRADIRKDARNDLLARLDAPLKVRGGSSLAQPWLVAGALRAHLDVAALNPADAAVGLVSVVSLHHSDPDYLRARITSDSSVWTQRQSVGGHVVDNGKGEIPVPLAHGTLMHVVHTPAESDTQRQTLRVLKQSWGHAGAEISSLEEIGHVAEELTAAVANA